MSKFIKECLKREDVNLIKSSIEDIYKKCRLTNQWASIKDEKDSIVITVKFKLKKNKLIN